LQKDSNGVTVEDALQQAIFKAGGIIASNLGSPSKLGWSRSSRTDKSVHSLATVVSMKMECNVSSFEHDPCGIGIANSINSYLPPAIRVFSVQRVTKNFNARGECIRRTYVYHLPAHVLGIRNTGGPLEGKEAEIMKALRNAWSMFQGNHAFHNYTKRRLYRDPAYRRPNRKGRESCSDSDDSDGGEDEERRSDSARQQQDGEPSLELFNHHNMSTLQSEGLEDDHNDTEQSPKPPKGKVNISWRPQRLEADPITRQHFRFNETCEASSEIEKIVSQGGVPCVKLTVRGASFMLHQIRHMVAAAVAVAIGKIPLDLLEASLAAPTRVNLPLAPASSLVLMDAEFSPFRVSWDGKTTVAARVTGDKLQLRGEGLELRRRFADETLLPAINELLQSTEWDAWKMDLDRMWMDDKELDNVMTEYRAWRAAWKAKREETLL
jgi:tRNA pseudouridine38-40 synthase